MVGASLKFQSSARIRESLSTGGKDTGSSGISGQVDATNMSSGTVLGHLKLHNINVKIEIFFCFNCLCSFISSVQAFFWWFYDFFCRLRILESKLALLVRIQCRLTKKPWETSLNSWKLLNARCRKKMQTAKRRFLTTVKSKKMIITKLICI